MNIISTDQEKYHFLNMCNLCRYAQFLQAQTQFSATDDNSVFMKFLQMSLQLFVEQNDKLSLLLMG